MCDEVCQISGWLGWLVFLLMLAGALGWFQWRQYREARRRERLEREYDRQLHQHRVARIRARPPRVVRIGRLREPVEVLDEPDPERSRPGRIRHRNGESAEVDPETLECLQRRARRRERTTLIA